MSPPPNDESPAESTSNESTSNESTSNESTARLMNIPNALCAIRLVGSFVLVGIAVAQAIDVFVGLLIFLLMTDWVDGKLAILLQQRTKFGAKLDTVADVALYTALLFGLVWLKGTEIASQWPWMVLALASYALSVTAALVKFGSFPAYHTRAAKTCWLLASIASIALFAGWSTWPIRLAALAITATNLEAVAITLVLQAPQVDLPSIYHAWQVRRND